MSGGEPGPAPARGRRLGGVASLVVLVAVLVVGGWYVWSRRAEVAAALAEIGAGAAVASLGLTLLGVLATGECWRVWLASLADPPPRRTAHQVFYLTQSGKYLPGSLWPFLAQALLARRFGVSRAAVLGATGLFLITHLVTGVVVGVAGAGTQVAARYAWLLWPAAVLGLVLLCPPVLARCLRVLERLRRRRAGGVDGVDRGDGVGGNDAAPAGTGLPEPTWRATGAAVLLMLLAWAAYGGATYVLLRPLAPDAWAALPLAVGAYALAWVVGFLAVAAPAGVGAREAVVVLVLGPVVGAPSALAVALVSRVALTLVDLGLAAASAGLLRRPPTGPGPAAVASAGPAR